MTQGLRDIYMSLLESDSGELDEAVALRIFGVLEEDAALLATVALRTAAYATVYPQVHQRLRRSASTWPEAERLERAADFESATADVLRGLAPAQDWLEAQTIEASHVVLLALELARTPTPAAWTAMLKAYRWSRLGGLRDPDSLRDGWIAWLDDVATVSVPGPLRALSGLRQAVLGCPKIAVDSWVWEGAYSEATGRYDVSACAVATGTLQVPPVLEVELASSSDGRLVVSVLPSTAAKDPFHVEHLVRHFVLREFLLDSRLKGISSIEFRGTSEGVWEYPLG